MYWFLFAAIILTVSITCNVVVGAVFYTRGERRGRVDIEQLRDDNRRLRDDLSRRDKTIDHLIVITARDVKKCKETVDSLGIESEWITDSLGFGLEWHRSRLNILQFLRNENRIWRTWL